MKIDMSPEAVTNRMIALDQLWELGVALRSSEIADDEIETSSPTYARDPDEEIEA